MPAYNPYAPPGAIEPSARRDGAFASELGNALIVSKEAPLPDVCVKCAAPSTTRRKQQFVYTPPWVFALMIFSLLIGAIVAMIVQKRGTLHLPLCESCARRWRHANLQMLLAALAIPVFLIFGVMIGSASDAGIIVAVAIGLGLVALVAVAIVHRDTRLQAKKVDNVAITLLKVHADARRAIVAALS